MTAIDRLTRLLERALELLLFGMFAMVAVLVVLRYVFASTIVGGNESVIVAFVYTTAIGASIALLRDEHIAISYFVEKMPQCVAASLLKVRLALLLIINVTLVACSFVWIRETGGFLMPTLGTPQWVAQISVPVGGALGATYCAVRLIGKN